MPNRSFKLAEYSNDGVYTSICEAGHETRTVLQEQLWEVLSNIGAFAVKDGYYREAVASYASCYERFHEFSIRVLLAETESEVFNSAWKNVKNSSERQLGAFIFLWTQKFGCSPKLLTQKEIEFRNDVIHKGRIPKREESVDFCSAVYNILRSSIATLKTQQEDSVGLTVINDIRRRNTEWQPNIVQMSIPTVVTLNGFMGDSFAQAMEQITTSGGS